MSIVPMGLLAACSDDGDTVQVSGCGGDVAGAMPAHNRRSIAGNGADSLQKCPLGGCPGNVPMVLAANQQILGLSNLIQLAADATNVYWPCTAEGTIKRVSINGGVPKTLVTGQSSPNAIVQDATAIYWTANGGGNIMKLAK